MKLDRRTVLASGAALAASLTVSPVFAGPPLDSSWVKRLPWVKANTPFSHISVIRMAGGKTFRIRHNLAFTAAVDLAEDIVYGESPSLVGLAAHYNTADATKAQNAVNVLCGTATSHRTSIWAVGWGAMSLHMVSPDGLAPSQGGPAGLVVKDWRYASRAANLRTADLSARLLDRILDRLPTHFGHNVQTSIYASWASIRAFADQGIVGSYRRVPIIAAPLRHDEEEVI